MRPRTVVLDANVLMRAVLGRKVSDLLERFAQRASFLTPEVAFDDVVEHLPAILARRDQTVALVPALDKLAALRTVVQAVQ